MAVKLITTKSRYIGLAADPKPTGVPVGSTFTAYDTKDSYVTRDGTNWTKDARNSEADRVSDWRKNSNL